MTYVPKLAVEKVSTELFHSKLSFSTSTQLGDYLNIDTPEFNDVTGLIKTSNSISLGGGYYSIQCTVGVGNSSTIVNNMSYQIEVDSSLKGNVGASTKDNKCGVDTAVCTIDVPSGNSVTVKIKVVEQNQTTTVDSDYCSLLIKRVAL